MVYYKKVSKRIACELSISRNTGKNVVIEAVSLGSGKDVNV